MWLRKLESLFEQALFKVKQYYLDVRLLSRMLWQQYCGLLTPTFAMGALLILLNIGTLMVADKAYRHYTAGEVKHLKADASLDEAAIYFEAKTHDIISAQECFPLHMNRPEGINILYLYCSPDAYARDGLGVQVTETFSVSPRIARRYNFWRRIYSLWGDDQYVLHLAEYPEVILEIGDASPLGVLANWQLKKERVNKILNAHRWQYKSMLWKMHKHRHNPELFSPAMRRIARSMQHISDPYKYMLAANNIRVQRGQRDQIAAGLSMATRYIEPVAEAFVQEGLPRELSQLAFIESSFNLKAYSKVGAAGVYQIMPSTGRQYMIVSDTIDERRDPIKSAHAAAKLLKMNKALLGEWPLAVTAYNHGAGGIRRAVKATGSNQIEDLIEKYNGPAFGFASKNFFSGFLAVMATIADSDRLFPEIQNLAPLKFEDIKLFRPTSMATVKKQYNLTNEIITMYNPDISRNFVRANGTLPKGYVLKIPKFELQVSENSNSKDDNSSVILSGAEE